VDRFTKKAIVTGLVLLIVGIILGAFGAHGLKGKVSPEKIASFEVGVRYQLIHALGFLALAFGKPYFQFSLKAVYTLLLLGVILFAGSIYGLTLQGLAGMNLGKVFGPMTPLGGLLLIIGWTVLLLKVVRTPIAGK
jgi:uncharacterized membrane protein YgdD (TMEM256/DUF423 family)